MNLALLSPDLVAVEDCENGCAFYRTRVRWSPQQETYFHIIYKPLDRDVLREELRILDAPGVVREMLTTFNGGRLFRAALVVFGVWPPGQLLPAGTDVFSLPSVDIAVMNVETDPELGFAVATYAEDGAMVTVDRKTARVACWLDGRLRCQWDSMNEWFAAECRRLGSAFDERGQLRPGQLFPVSPEEP